MSHRLTAAVGLLAVLACWPVTTSAQQDLAIYYGWPSLVNGAAGDHAAAVAAFAPFELIVFGDGLQDPAHGDHEATAAIVAALVAGGAEVFGYVDMGMTTQALPVDEARARVDAWAALGVTGIFWDDAGFDFGVDRTRQTALIGHTHDAGLVAFVNAWDPADVFDTAPGDCPSPLRAGDLYLAESHPVAGGAHGPLDAWWSKSLAIDAWRAATGVRIAAVSTGDDGPTGWPNHTTYRQALWAARLFRWDAFGFTNAQYSASGPGANRLRPLPSVWTDDGAPTGPPAQQDATTYTRSTSTGRIVVWGGEGEGGGTFHGGPCDTTALGPAIWPSCAAAPPPHSSPFGPRQMASEGFRYDWHRGVDLPQPLGDPVYAPFDGVVRIAGDHAAYSDGVVQLRHRARSPYLYSNVLHMGAVDAPAGALVTAGDLLGRSGASASGFPHMHFELRDGCLNQPCNRNPWAYLPYDDAPPPVPTLAGAWLGDAGALVVVDLTTPAGQLDLDGADLSWGGQAASVAFDALNATTDAEFPAGMDHPAVDLGGGVVAHLFPKRFSTGEAAAGWRIAWAGLPAAPAGAVAGRDVRGLGEAVAVAPDLPPLWISQPTQTALASPGATVRFSHVLQNRGETPLEIAFTAQSAQRGGLELSTQAVTLDADEATRLDVDVTLGADHPLPIGDSVLLLASVAGHDPIATVSTVATTAGPPPPCEPALHFTDVPAWDSDGDLRGEARCVESAEWEVVAFIFTNAWWNKPTFSSPTAALDGEGAFVIDITTGPGDPRSTEIAAFLVPTGYRPPLLSGARALPAELAEVSAASLLVTRGPAQRTIDFAGRPWRVKRSDGPVGPGPNVFSDADDDVFVDDLGHLHLRIRDRGDAWISSEVITADPLGYGTYRFRVGGGVDRFDPHVVVGLFTWDPDAPEHAWREIDVEIARWGWADNDPLQYVVQPWETPGNLARFAATLPDTSTHQFTWQPHRVDFASWHGVGDAPAPGAQFAAWSYRGADVPPAGDANARINLWLTQGLAPGDGRPVELVVESFEHLPLGPEAVDLAVIDLYGAGTIDGDFTRTFVADGVDEVLTEVLVGDGAEGHSRLEHQWCFDVTGGQVVEVLLRAAAGASRDGDAYDLSWSTDRATWRPLLRIDQPEPREQRASLPVGTSGTVFLRAADTDRAPGHTALDTLRVDLLEVRSR